MTPVLRPAGRARAGGPYLILAALWLDADETDRVAGALRVSDFPVPAGYPRGCVVSFRREVATGAAFMRDLSRFDLAELAPPTATAQPAPKGS